MRNHDNAQTRKIKKNQRQAIHKYKLKLKMNSFLSKTCKEVRYQVLKEKLTAGIKGMLRWNIEHIWKKPI